MIKRWLIHWLGGFTSEEANKACSIVSSMTELKLNIEHAQNMLQIREILADPAEKPADKPAVH